MAEQPGQRGPSLVRRVLGGGELAGIAAQQVMQPVPIRPGGLDHVCADEQVNRVPCLLERGAGDRCGGVQVEIWARVRADQPEPARGYRIQVPVGPREDRTHPRARITARLEQVKPPLADQFFSQGGEGNAGAGRRPFGGHPQRQREPRAPLR